MLATAAITEKIASELQTAGRPLSLSELSDTTKGDRAALKEKLDDLVDTGHIKHRTINTDSWPPLDLYWITSTANSLPSVLVRSSIESNLVDADPPDTERIAAQKAALTTEIASLQHRLADLTQEGKAILDNLSPGTDVEKEITAHIKRLHDYNEIKDIGQLLMGKLAEKEGTTTRSMYARFELDPED